MKHLIILLMTTISLFAQTHFILIGPPGSGKGTFAYFMSSNHNYKQITPGDILRSHVKNNTEIGQQIKPILESGDFVPNHIVYKIIEDSITECLENNIAFIIDGIPPHCYDFLDSLFTRKNIDSDVCFVYFKVDDETCIKRVNQRLVCLNCASIFNSFTRKPKLDMICDNCENKLEYRMGDTTTNTIKRLKYYKDIVEPIIKLAENKYKIFEIDATQNIDNLLNLYKHLETL